MKTFPRSFQFQLPGPRRFEPPMGGGRFQGDERKGEEGEDVGEAWGFVGGVGGLSLSAPSVRTGYYSQSGASGERLEDRSEAGNEKHMCSLCTPAFFLCSSAWLRLSVCLSPSLSHSLILFVSFASPLLHFIFLWPSLYLLFPPPSLSCSPLPCFPLLFRWGQTGRRLFGSDGNIHVSSPRAQLRAYVSGLRPSLFTLRILHRGSQLHYH